MSSKKQNRVSETRFWYLKNTRTEEESTMKNRGRIDLKKNQQSTTKNQRFDNEEQRQRTDLSGRLDDLILICTKNSEEYEEEEVWVAHLLQFCFYVLHRHHPNKLLPFAGGGSHGGAGIGRGNDNGGWSGGGNGGWSWWVSLLCVLGNTLKEEDEG